MKECIGQDKLEQCIHRCGLIRLRGCHHRCIVGVFNLNGQGVGYRGRAIGSGQPDQDGADITIGGRAMKRAGCAVEGEPSRQIRAIHSCGDEGQGVVIRVTEGCAVERKLKRCILQGNLIRQGGLQGGGMIEMFDMHLKEIPNRCPALVCCRDPNARYPAILVGW